MTFRRTSLLNRVVALALTWAMPGSTAWALTPPRLSVPPPASTPSSLESERPIEAEAPAPPVVSGPLSDDHHDNDDDDDAVRPILECVVRHSSDSYTAYFGFKNETDQTVSISLGSKNAFSPSPQNRNQPTSFPKGRSPYYPGAAFSVAFNGSNLTWSLKGPDNHTRTATANASSPRCQSSPTPTPTPTPTATPTPLPTPGGVCSSPILGTRRFTRTCDDQGPTVYNQTFTIPAGSVGPYTLRVVNGDAQGRNRTSSAEVKINGIEIVKESDFSQNVATFTKSIASLLPTNQLYVRVKSSPGSTFTLDICGAGQTDTVPPAVEWLAPVSGSLSKDPTPLFRVRYSDLVSPPNTSTLKILVDGVDRTAVFSPQPDEAAVDDLIALSDGSHTVRAEIKDAAGNQGVGASTFRIDAQAPALAIVAPPTGAVLSATRPLIQITFADEGTQPSGLNLAALDATVDGVSVASSLNRAATEAVGQVPLALANGSHTLITSITDLAGNTSTRESAFIIDTVPPVLTTAAPAANQLLGASRAEIFVHYSDNQSLNLDSFTARVDGAPLALLTVDADTASGTTATLPDGPHVLSLSIADRAGNVTTTSTPFRTDTGLPEIAVTPLNGVLLNTSSPEFRVTFSDPQGIAPASLKVRVDDVDRTAAFLPLFAPNEARAILPGPLVEGIHTVVAEIRDSAGNLGAVTSSFTLDLTPPVLTIAAPLAGARLNDSTPGVSIGIRDLQTGVEPTAVRVILDDLDVTGSLAVSPEAITGTLSTPLSEGPHVLRVTVPDRAQNPTIVNIPFFVDLTPPTLEMARPLANGFINDATPEVWLRTADPLGNSPSGVDAASIRVWLLSEDPMEGDTDITAQLMVGPADTRGEFLAALTNGSHRLRAVASDLAGNESEITVGFVIDTVAPTIEIDQPQTSTFVNSGAPTIVLLYGDERSGIDSALTQLRVDGVERSASLATTPTGATITLLGALSLSDGAHTIEARVIDRAGNATDATPVTFGVDSSSPVVSITAPTPGMIVSTPSIVVAASFSDPDALGRPGSAAGIDPESTRAFVDGVDRTAQFTLGPLTAGATLGGLVSGIHTIRIEVKDPASNTASATTSFIVDADPPQVTIDGAEAVVVGPAALPGGRYRVTGSAVDADPGFTVTCAIGPASMNGTISSGRFECDVPLSNGVNVISVTARDSGGRETSATRTVTLDPAAPVITILSPPGAVVTAAATFDVAIRVTDDTAVDVTIGGVAVSPGACSGSAPAGCDYNATVALGGGPIQQIVVLATDAAQNQAQQIATVVIDRNAPRVTITRPTPGVIVKPGLVSLEVVVLDQTPTTLSVTGSNQPIAPSSCAPEGADTRCVFETDVPVAEGQNDISVSARDAAGNESVAHVAAVADGVPPALTLVSPAPLVSDASSPVYVTNVAALALTGQVLDASPLTLSLNGSPVAVAPEGSFSADLPLPVEGVVAFTLLARDVAGNETVLTRSLRVDRTAPIITIASPVSGATLSTASTIVQGTVIDVSPVTIMVDGSAATVVGDAFQSTMSDLQDGSRTFTVTATDAAGNTSTASRTVEVDLSPPTLAITSPANGALTRESSTSIALTVNDRSATTIRQGATVVLSCAGGTCAQALSVQLAEGDNTFTFEATDVGGRSAAASVTITRDSTPPTIDLSTPLTVSRTRSGNVSALSTDAGGVASVVATLVQTGATLCAGAGSCQVALLAPASSTPGMSLTIRAVATDVAGNTATTDRSIRVIGEGAVAGQALNDRTSLPLSDVSVSLVAGEAGVTVSTDNRGRYSLPARNAAITLRLDKPGYTTVERNVAIEALTGTVPVDARLTPLRQAAASSGAAPIAFGPGIETDWLAYSLNAPAGELRFTPLSSQGLPNLLPAGFAPVAAFDLATSLPGPFTLTVFGMRPSATAHLARYNFELHDWRLVATPIAIESGSATLDLPEPGSYALVVADETGTTSAPVVIPAVGDAFLGVPTALIPSTATSEGVVNPSVLSPAGGVATGTLRIAAPSAAGLSSGTIVQAEVTEEYTLSAAGTAPATEEKRTMDIVLYRAPVVPAPPSGSMPALPCAVSAASNVEGTTNLCATFPISPSRTYATPDLVEGKVHLDILAGREGARGLVGGSEAITLNDRDIDFIVAAGSTAEDIAMEISVPAALSSFVPSDETTAPLSEIVIDLFGASLNQSAVLRFPGAGVAQGGTLVVGRVVRIQDGAATTGTTEGGTPRFEIVSMAEIVGDHIETRPGFGLPGIKQEGRYVLFRLANPVGFVSGIATAAANGAPVRAVLLSAGLPFIAVAGADGGFLIPALPGNTRISASVPGSSLAGEVTPLVAASAVTVQNLALAGVVSQAAFSVPSGASKVEINQTFALVSPVALKAATVSATNITLLKITPGAGGNPPVLAPVAIRILLSGSGKRVSISAVDPLSFDTQYTLQATGLVDTVDGLVTVASSTFRTKDDTPPFYDPRNLKIGLPNAQGLAPITAAGCWPATGCFYPGTTALIINTSNGMVVTLSAGNNGEFNSDILAKTSDRLVITVTDPFGNQTTFQKSEFTDETTGQTGIGAGGGRVTALNPTNDPETAAMELNIPEGAFPEGTAVKFKISKATREEAMPQEPDLPGFHFGSAIRIESEGWDAPLPEGREIDISFPRPDFSVLPESERPSKPEDVHYWVVRKIVKDDGNVMYEVLDYADPDPASGTGLAATKVRTASFPWPGLSTLSGVLIGTAVVEFAFLMWQVNKLTPPRATQGILNGRVFRQVYKAGQAEPITAGIAGAVVSEAEVIPGSNPVQYRLLAAEAGQTGPLAATTQKDGMFTATIPRFEGGQKLYGAKVEGVVYVGSTYQVVRNDSKTQGNAGLLQLFSVGFSNNVAYVDINLPAATAPPIAPQIDIRLLDISSTPRRALSNVVIAGEPVRFGFRTKSRTSTPDPTPGVNRADITGPSGTTAITLQVDPMKASNPTSPLAYDHLSNDDFIPATPGTYTITAVRTPALGPPIEEAYTFRAIAPGGSIKTSVPGRPGVLADQTKPKRDGRGQPITTAPQLVFSEPVTNVPGNVKLKDGAGNVVPVRISAIALDVNGDEIVIPDLQSSSAKITGLTLEPLANLRYGNTYTISLTAAIVDLDTPEAQSLVPYSSSFTTFAPEELGGSEAKPIVAGIAVLGDRAYAAETNYAGGIGGASQSGNLVAFDVTDPSQPTQVDPKVAISFPPRDIAAGETTEQGTDPLSGQPIEVTKRMVAVVTQPRTYYKAEGELVFYTSIVSSPAHLFLYDVTDPSIAPKWTGVASLSANIDDGTPSRLKIKGSKAYVAMFGRGIVVADLDQAKNGFSGGEVPAVGTAARRDLDLALNQGGVNRSAAGTIIKIVDSALGSATDPRVDNAPLSKSLPVIDLDVADMPVNGSVQRIILATSMRREAALILATGVDPYPLVRRAIPGMVISSAVALTKVDGRDLAIVGGFKDAKWGIATIDLSPLAAPIPQGQQPPELPTLWFTEIPDLTGIGDIEMLGTTAVVTSQVGIGKATLIDINVTTPPVISGVINGVASRVAASDKVLFSADGRVFVPGAGTSDALHGVKTAALGNFAVVRRVSEDPVILDLNRNSIEAQAIEVAVIPAAFAQDVVTAKIEVRDGETVRQSTTVAIDASGRGSITVPEGISHPVSGLAARLVVNGGLEGELIGAPRLLRVDQFEVEPHEVDEPTVILAEPGDVSATSQALIQRIGKNPEYRPPVADWIIEDGVPGASVTPINQRLDRGIYTGEFSGSRPGRYRAEMRMNGHTVGRTGAMELLVGEARGASITATRLRLPADGASLTQITLSDIRDGLGNPVPNGTEVHWFAEGPSDADEGDIVGGDLSTVAGASSTSGGSATVQYRAGLDEGTVRVYAAAGDLAPWVIEIQQEELNIALDSSNWPDLVATVWSAAGTPSDEMEIAWGTVFPAKVTFEGHPIGGVAEAHWEIRPSRAGQLAPKKGYVIVTAGRKREYHFEVLDGPPAPGEVRAAFGETPVALWDATKGAPQNPSTGTVRVTGGQPGQIVTLALGSRHQPVVEPVVAFGFTRLSTSPGGFGDATRTTSDVSGLLAGQVSGSAEFDATHPTFSEGTFKFDGSGLVTFAENPALDPDSQFGVNGWLRLDSIAPGQMVLRKAGSYEVAVVDQGGTPGLQFAIYSAETKSQVTVPLPADAGDWFPFSGRLQDGRISLAVGFDSPPTVGDSVGVPDSTHSELAFGEGLRGNLAEVGLYDFSRVPFMSFENGATTANVVLDGAGEGQIGVVAGPTGLSQFIRNLSAPGFGSEFERRLRIGTLRTFEPNHPAELIWDEMRALLPQMRDACSDALLSGEPANLVGMLCEVYTGFTPAAPVQSVRDLLYVSRNLIQSKPAPGDRLKAAFAVVALIPALAAALRGYRSGRGVLGGTRLLPRIETGVLKTVAKALAGAIDDAPEKVLLNLAETGSDGAKGALRRLFSTCVVASIAAPPCLIGINPKYWPRLGEVQRALSATDETLVLKLAQVLEEGRFNAREVESAILRLADLNVHRIVPNIGKMPRALSADALEGLLVLMRNSGSPNRLKFAWVEMVQGLGGDTALAMDRMEEMFRLMSKADKALPDNPGLRAFIAHGPGTCIPCRSTAGFVHHLEYMDKLGFDKIHSIDSIVDHFPGRPDLIVRVVTDAGNGLKQIELKNLWPGRLLSGRALAQLARNIKAAVARAEDAAALRRSATPSTEEVMREMPIYVFRGLESLSPGLRAQLRAKIESALPSQFKDLATIAASPGGLHVTFLGKTSPF